MITRNKYVHGATRLWTDLGAMLVSDLVGLPTVTWDAFGNRAVVKVEEVQEPMALVALGLDTGQIIPIGAETELLTVKPGDARPTFRKVTELQLGAHYVWMPSRKIKLSEGTIKSGGDLFVSAHESQRIDYLADMYDSFGEDNIRPNDYRSMAFLAPKTFNDFRDGGELLGMYGMAATFRPSDNRIEVDPGRPSCFATKLLAGRASDPDDLINDLIDSHIIDPALPYAEMVEFAERVGLICEGETHAALRMLVPALHIDQRHKVYSVTLTGEARTIDTPWFKL